MTHRDFCLFLNAQYWAFRNAGFHATAKAIGEWLRAEKEAL